MWYVLVAQIAYIILNILGEIMNSPLGEAFKNWYNKNPIDIKK